MKEGKKISETLEELAELMLPAHANPAGLVHGGTIIKMIDTAGAIVAVRHSQHHVVTTSVDRIDFIAPAYVGNLIIAKAALNYVSRTSMEVGVRVESERLIEGERIHNASAYLTYVALDENKKPTEIPMVNPETSEEIRRFEQAKKRREKRLKELNK